ncbi:MAG: SDR family NAD(P)-dependent oxidoreductase [Methyloligellaceae bacterium]
MSRLHNKIAIVTGAGGGIGRAICRAFCREGAAVIAIDINADTVSATVEEIVGEEGQDGRCVAFVGDVADEETAIGGVRLAQEKFGAPNVLVNNAVFDLPFAPLTDISLPDWQRTLDVNLTSAFLMSKHVIPPMAGDGGGSIIHVASQLGGVARPGRPWYCAAKGGLVSLAQAMAVDHAHQKIRVNSLSPGPVETGRYVKNFDSVEAARASNYTLYERLGEPDEIANGAVFLASNESSFMTGADLLIDGGYCAV